MQGAALLTINCPLHPITGVTPTPQLHCSLCTHFPLLSPSFPFYPPLTSPLPPISHLLLYFTLTVSSHFYPLVFVTYATRMPSKLFTPISTYHLPSFVLPIFTFSPQLRVGLFTPQMLTSWVPPELCLMLKGRNARAMRIRLWGGVGERTKLEKKRGRTKHSSNS